MFFKKISYKIFFIKKKFKKMKSPTNSKNYYKKIVNTNINII